MSSWPSWGNVASLDITLPWPTSSTTSLASVNPSPLPEQPPWLSLQFRTLVLGSVVPTVVVLSILAYDVISAIELPKMLTTFLWLIASPFTNFLNLDDLEDDAGVTYTPRIWKDRILAISSALQAVAWAAFFCYIELVGEHGSGRGVEAGVGFVSWV